jgi:hypothetical protein
MPLALHRVKAGADKWPNGTGIDPEERPTAAPIAPTQLTPSGKECLPLGLEAAEGQTEPVRWRERKSR